jgi:hypothetical protein
VSAAVEKVDRAPGNYYVSVVDGPRMGLLAGPFPNDHEAALAMVERAREAAQKADPWSHFYAFGTVRMAPDYTKPGRLNRELGL